MIRSILARRPSLVLYLLLTAVPFAAIDTARAAPQRRDSPTSAPEKVPNYGAVYVDIVTDSKGNVARLDFLNNVPNEIQEWIRKKTLGQHFGVPNHTYRRHVEYQLTEPPKKKQ